MLIQSVNKLKAYKLTMVMSNGAYPENGITIAAEKHSDMLTGIEIQSLKTIDNLGVGLEITPGVNMSTKFSIIVKSYTSIYDGEFAPVYLRNSPKNGKVTLKNLSFKHKEGYSALIRTWDTRNCPVSIFSSTLNGNKAFEYVIADQVTDPFASNMEKLYISK